MMNKSSLPKACAAVCVLGAAGLVAPGQAQDYPWPVNRFSVASRFGFNLTTEVKNLAPPVSGTEYDDGFVRPDISRNAGGRTWYWSYQRDDQLAGNNVDLHRTSSPRDGTSDRFKDNPQPGFEAGYSRLLGRVDFRNGAKLGFGGAVSFTFTDVSVKRQQTLNGAARRQTDRFNLGGATPPHGPYAGTFDGPGPLLAATPDLSFTTAVPAVSTLSASLDGLVYGFKVGPFLQVPIGWRLAVEASGGFAAANVEGDFKYSEAFSVQTPGAIPVVRDGRVTGHDWLMGFYANLSLSYALSDLVSVFVAGQYQDLGTFTLHAPGKDATLWLDRAYEILGGVRFGF